MLKLLFCVGYLVPVIDRILKKRPPAPSAVIIVPNMDLGFQVSFAFKAPVVKQVEYKMIHRWVRRHAMLKWVG